MRFFALSGFFTLKLRGFLFALLWIRSIPNTSFRNVHILFYNMRCGSKYFTCELWSYSKAVPEKEFHNKIMTLKRFSGTFSVITPWRWWPWSQHCVVYNFSSCHCIYVSKKKSRYYQIILLNKISIITSFFLTAYFCDQLVEKSNQLV